MRYALAAVVAAITLWALGSTIGFMRARAPQSTSSPSRADERSDSIAELVRVRKLADVVREVRRAGIRDVLVLDAGRPRRVETFTHDGGGLLVTTVYRFRGRPVTLQQSTGTQRHLRQRLAYVSDVPGTAQSRAAFHWAERGFIVSLSRSAAGVAASLRWHSPPE